MELKLQKRLAAQVMKCSPKKVWFDDERLEDIKEAITKVDIRSMISKGLIRIKPVNSPSKGRARHRASQRRKGRMKGQGSKKGRATARLQDRDKWKNAIRAQRDLIKYLRKKGVISKKDHRMLYMKCKGGFFRSRRHIKLFLEEKGISKQPIQQTKQDEPAKKQ